MAAIITGLKHQLRTIGLLHWTKFGISCEEEPTEWTAEDHDNICDNILGKRLSPEAVQTGRRQQLKLMHRLPLLKEVPVERCWLETNAKPIGTKWIDINKGDGDPIEIRPSLVARELGVHQVKKWASCETTSSERHQRLKPCDS